MRLIDADELLKYLSVMYDRQNDEDEPFNCAVLAMSYHIKDAPIIDAVEVVRCYECKHRTYCYSEIAMTNKSQTADIYKSVNFCSYGEKEKDHE